MIRMKDIILSVFVGSLLTFGAMTVSLLITIFRTIDPGINYAFFHTMFFENQPLPNDALEMTVGFTGSFMPIIFSIIGLSVVIVLTLFFYKVLSERRRQLLNREKHGQV